MSGLFSRSGAGGAGGGGQRPPHTGHTTRGQYDRMPSGTDERYGGSQYIRPQYSAQDERSRLSGGLPNGPRMQTGGVPTPTRQPHSALDKVWQLRPAKSPSNEFTFGNIVAVSPDDFPPPKDGGDFYIALNDSFVLTARLFPGFPTGQLSLSDAQRTWASISLQDWVNVRIYDPFSEGDHRYLASIDAEVAFAGRKSTAEQIDQDELASIFIKNYESQVFAPGQRLIMDFKSLPLLFVIKTVSLGDLSMEKEAATGETMTRPDARAILTRSSQMNFFKDAKTTINLKASKRRPPANAILQPNFNFEAMGIGGLDKEFSVIFRRAFASRIFPPGLIQNMGIQHVKGLLLYGPPGTGKTLIARKIGQMLNAREPKIINGPEVLNKFVGQSEENIRKLFADAEKEYKEKGDESGLHIIIFDELDAICKQRGSGAGGGTGVGDSVVNQLLSKLDGVDQLNNILLIGMTNRKDMIDDALLRPGRLEVHVEISLPDEAGRGAILNIHTATLRKHDMLDPDVNIEQWAQLTKNFSGAELSGLVRSATSFAINRRINVDKKATPSSDIENTKVNQDDFSHAFDEVKPLFGRSEDDLHRCIDGGIIPFSDTIGDVLQKGQSLARQVQREGSYPVYSAVLYGPDGSGKTALAVKIALESGYPFVRMCAARDMVGLSDTMKCEHIKRIFQDAYKSRLSMVIVDNIEGIVGWSAIGPRFENLVLQAIKILVKSLPPKGHRLLILATTSDPSALEDLDLFKSFNQNISVPSIQSYEELRCILKHTGKISNVDRALSDLRELWGNKNLNFSVKEILLAIDNAEEYLGTADQFSVVLLQSRKRERQFE